MTCTKCSSENIVVTDKKDVGIGIIGVSIFFGVFLFMLILPTILMPFGIIAGLLYRKYGHHLFRCKDCKSIYTKKERSMTAN